MNVEQILQTKTPLPLRQRSVIHLVLVHYHVYDTLTQALKPFEVSVPQFNVLRILRGQKGEPANLSTINGRMINKMSNTTRLVDKLIAKGFVRRNICPENRRKVEIFLTDQGAESLREMDKAVAGAEATLMQHFSDQDLKDLNNLLDQIES
ncbi:MarR family winged helix-turn-helix transcriptional regulator [Robiginitalea sediminis]|uniref:MarR family winged helix-turn-helix transcriptional regulator n=1 Tax=Robiginitalea sediminis TaxID=1982593 RepID=UPI000B4B40E3|nr:MarR family transcriptional regulator [Robiginitalea sediminis]